MNAIKKYALVLLLATLSTLLFAIAFGTQEGWRPALLRWTCEPPAPAAPDPWQALRSLSLSFWLLAGWNALVLFWLAFVQSRGWRRVAWLPVIVFHFFMRFMALTHAKEFEGICGVHEGAFMVLVAWEFAAVLLVPLYAAALAAISAVLRKMASRPVKAAGGG